MECSFANDGYAVLPVFDPAQVRAARGDIADQVDRLCRALYLPFAESRPEAPIETRIDRLWQTDRSQANLLRTAICTDAHRGPRLAALASGPALKSVAERLCGGKIDGTVVRVRAGIAAFPEQLHGWHSDVARDDGTDCARVRITAWIPLGDAGPDSGGLEVVPGRRLAPFPHREDRGFTIEDTTLEGLERARPLCPAGSAIFLDRFTPHRSLPVRGDARFALVVWMKAGAPAPSAR